MPKFEFRLSHKQFFTLEIEAESEEEARQLYEEGDFEYDLIEPEFDDGVEYEIESIKKL